MGTITTIAELIEAFKQYSLQKMQEEDSDITHTVSIGDSFEGLTAAILQKSIFEGLDLRVVKNSFVINDSGGMSPEVDCMLVIGDGRNINFTERYVYHIKNVIAVIQVKKRLYANDIISSHENLRAVAGIAEPWNEGMDMKTTMIFRDSYKSLVSKELPSAERKSRFTERENIAYSILMMEAILPLRIVIGYYGYVDEFTLREGFVEKLGIISNDGPIRGISPASFPSLIICGNSSIVKNVGMPFALTFSDKEFYWDVLLTADKNPMYYLLELIWTRLSYKFDIPSIDFDDNLEIDHLKYFLSCKEKRFNDDSLGFELLYNFISEKNLKIRPEILVWEPCKVDKNQYIILLALSKGKMINMANDSDFSNFLISENINIHEILKHLIEARLIYVDDNKIGLLADNLMMVSYKGQWYAGDNKNGLMSRYFAQPEFRGTGKESPPDGI